MTPLQRLQEIGRLLADGMKLAEGVDWTRETPQIVVAQSNLDEQVTLYCEDRASKPDVRRAYQAWRDLHKTGGLPL